MEPGVITLNYNNEEVNFDLYLSEDGQDLLFKPQDKDGDSFQPLVIEGAGPSVIAPEHTIKSMLNGIILSHEFEPVVPPSAPSSEALVVKAEPETRSSPKVEMTKDEAFNQACDVLAIKKDAFMKGDQDAQIAMLKSAYRKASLASHPDKGGSETQFQAVNAAKNLLEGFISGVDAVAEAQAQAHADQMNDEVLNKLTGWGLYSEETEAFFKLAIEGLGNYAINVLHEDLTSCDTKEKAQAALLVFHDKMMAVMKHHVLEKLEGFDLKSDETKVLVELAIELRGDEAPVMLNRFLTSSANREACEKALSALRASVSEIKLNAIKKLNEFDLHFDETEAFFELAIGVLGDEAFVMLNRFLTDSNSKEACEKALLVFHDAANEAIQNKKPKDPFLLGRLIEAATHQLMSAGNLAKKLAYSVFGLSNTSPPPPPRSYALWAKAKAAGDASAKVVAAKIKADPPEPSESPEPWAGEEAKAKTEVATPSPEGQDFGDFAKFDSPEAVKALRAHAKAQHQTASKQLKLSTSRVEDLSPAARKRLAAAAAAKRQIKEGLKAIKPSEESALTTQQQKTAEMEKENESPHRGPTR